MAIVVEHDKRRRKILEKSLELFIEEGYEDVTFQKIADRCGITRTTLYIYFQNKRDIFIASIKQLGNTLEGSLNLAVTEKNISSQERLKKVLMNIYDCVITHRHLFMILLPYFLQIQKAGINPAERVARRTIKIRHLLSSILIEGKNSGEFKKDLEIKTVNEVLYSLLEGLIFKITIMNQKTIPEFEKMCDLAILNILA